MWQSYTYYNLKVDYVTKNSVGADSCNKCCREGGMLLYLWRFPKSYLK